MHQGSTTHPRRRKEVRSTKFSLGGDEVEWAGTPDQFSLGNADPAFGLRPPGSKSQFWNSGDETPPFPPSTPRSPSTASLIRFAVREGFSEKEMVETAAVVDCPSAWQKVLAQSTPEFMDRPTALARKIVSVLAKGRSACGSWRGPLPARRISPPLTLGDCPIKEVQRSRSGEVCRHREVGEGVQNPNLDPVSSLGHRRPGFGVWLKDGPSWVRVVLCSAVGRLLSRRGTLPTQFRSASCAAQTLADPPSYAAVVAGGRVAMAGNGMRSTDHNQGFINQQQGTFSSNANFQAGGAIQGDGSGQFMQGQGWGNRQQGAGGGGFHGGQQWSAPGLGIPQQVPNIGVQQSFVQQGMNSGGSFPPQQNQQFFPEGNTSLFNQSFPLRTFNPGYGAGRGGQRQRGRGRDRGRGRQQSGRGYGGRGASIGHQFGGDGNQPPQHVPAMGQNVTGQTFGGRPMGNTVEPKHFVAPSQAGPSSSIAKSSPVETHKRSDVQQSEGKGVQDDENKDDKLTGENRKKKKGKGKQEDAWCFRCCSKGHISAECTTQLFCNICESDEHVAAKCPLKKKPKPVALAVGYAVDDLGFYHIAHGPIPMSKLESNTVLIKVEGGSLTEVELIGHLKRLVSTKFEWDVQIIAPNMWAAPFPSKADFTRAINFGSADLKNGLRLSFEKYEEEDEYFGHELPMVWMRTVNLPKVLRTYEVLWAIGTMFGATQKVDMITTRKNKFGRFKVAVLNPTIVPNKMDCVIGTRFFELRFVIEPFNPNAESDPIQKEGHDDQNGDDNGQRDADTEMEDASKKPKRVDSSSAKSMENNNLSTSTGGQQEDNGFNLDEDDLLDDGGDERVTQFSAPCLQHNREGAAELGSEDGEKNKEAASEKEENRLQMKEAPTSHTFEENVLETGRMTNYVNTLELPSPALGPFLERALNGLKEAQSVVEGLGDGGDPAGAEGFTTPPTLQATDNIITPLRRSKRRAATADEDSIDRASRLVAKKNLEVDGGHLQRDALDSFLDFATKGRRATPSYAGVPCA
ncbi:unnamed protein product [Urochloa humidicola]